MSRGHDDARRPATVLRTRDHAVVPSLRVDSVPTLHARRDQGRNGGAPDGSPASWRDRLDEPSLCISLQRLAGNRAVASLAARRDQPDGGGKPTVQRGPPDSDLLDPQAPFVGPLSVEQEAAMKDRARQLASHLQAAWIDASTHGNGWIAAASDFGLCYHDAFERHEAVREEQERADKLVADVAFGALTLVAGGALGSLATIAKNQSFFKTMPDWKADGILEVTKGTAAKAFEGIAQPEVKSHKVATDPLRFYLDLKNAVDHQVAETTKYINRFVQRADQYVAGERPLHDLFYIDLAVVRDRLKTWKASQAILREAPAVPKEDLTKELEIGLWAKWVPGLHTVSQRVSHCAGTVRTVHSYSGPGGHVEDRIKALRIPGFPADIDWGTLWMSDEDIKKLIAWGQSWQPANKFELG